MTFSSEWRDSFVDGYDYGRSGGNALPQRLFGTAALVSMAFACAFGLWNSLNGAGAERAGEAQAIAHAASQAAARVAAKSDALRLSTAAAYAKLATAMKSSAKTAGADAYAALFDSRHLFGFRPATFEPGVPLFADGGELDALPGRTAVKKTQAAVAKPKAEQVNVAAAQPHVPPIRTASLHAVATTSDAAADTPTHTPSIFERLFGRPSPLTLAYAAPDDKGLGDGGSIAAARYDRETAVYDISAHTVYLPDGTTLEAHSGYGSNLDDPRSATERMRGVTPPTTYELKPRESPFHGVAALRLIPLDEDKVHGRSGLLAHTFMLGPNGQSNGCVSFRNYQAFLQAYLNNKIKRLAVVARL
jgi:Protein of unknown function (DUF2778)